jgi:hypothetical protein
VPIQSRSRRDRKRRRDEAEARNEARRQLSVDEQLAILDTRPGNSVRERVRLTQQEQ